MNKSTKMKIRVLKNALSQIRDRKENFVCFAIENVKQAARDNFSSKDNRHVYAAARELLDEIRKIFIDAGISPATSVGFWLVKIGVLTREELENMPNETMRLYREAWLTAWIADLKRRHRMFDPLKFKKIELLLAARGLIENKSATFLCVALERAAEHDFQDRDVYVRAADELQFEISKAFVEAGVVGVASVFAWLLKTGVISNDEFVSDEQLREYRLRWIDSWVADLRNGEC